uniref:SWR1 complex subunit 2 n=1 Tax=Erigeron canadensis TaxID=72917 RepID=UPI001CB94E26|nr:SWR1 complex subunit 2 [Erigeron canadensis]XP_043632421.1 SWR1 complex subunit 2 [Erigeron canadensis]XP_043632422.1 SWR1 complex subunit 2 [Erigeron canadensis]XP_043632423.1 SWR1 complex subunit 2 [Erigeron canadensis]XP_043632424.1 SWR1 complex subunit 2 [Erigeron canadensis]
MGSDKEDGVVFLDRASRATRGKRMTKLVDDEIEEDNEFWNQEALKEEEDDTNYVEENEAVDVFDSDFDEDEPEAEEETDNEPDDRKRPRKRLIYPGKPRSAPPVKQRMSFPGKELPKKKKMKVLSEPDSSNGDDTNPEQSKSTPQEDHDVNDDTEVEKTTRKSTRTAVVVRQAERDANRAALQATMKPIKRKKEGEEKKMTQEEMLLEAAQTEIMNLRNLERVLAREEEVKKKAIVHKAVYTGPQIRYLSKDGYSYLEFINGVTFQSQIPTSAPPYPDKAICAVTGLPAKYRDPKTGLPYANKEAFKIIRERLVNENSGTKEKNSMGMLYDLAREEGFTKKKRRSINPNSKENSYLRSSARFRQIPAFEYIDSE